MFLRILKKDLKRKKTMNLILLLFIILASMFVASGLNNVITVMNGTAYYLDKAGVGDYVILTQGQDVTGNIDAVLKEEKSAKSYTIENVVFGAEGNVYLSDGKEADVKKNAILFQSIEDSKLVYFDKDDKPIKDVAQGHVFVSGNFLEDNEMKEGDKIRIRHEGVEMELAVDGKVKDALLGSEFMGNRRFILNEQDMKKFRENEKIEKFYRGEIANVKTDDLTAMSSAVTKIQGVSFSGARSMIEMCYVMDLIVALVILILSICLIIVSFVVLKFSITFTITEEFREIGVMKAIGITNKKIRALYIGKYLMLAVVGALIGLAASIPFANLLMQSVRKNMMLGNDMGLLLNLIGALVVIALILFFAYHCTGKVKKSSPIDAIRSGQTGERYRKKAVYRIGNSHLGTSLYMAVNDVLSSPRRFITILFPFFLCTLFVLLLVNTTTTMDSDSLVETFGSRSDLYITETEEAMKNSEFESREEYQKYLDKRAEELTKKGMPAKMCVELMYKYPVSFEGKDFLLTCQQGLGIKATEYAYTEGEIPQNGNEIAITSQISEKTGAKIGDTVTIDFGSEKKDCVVTAYFETMNQLGDIIRLHEDAPTDMKNIATVMQTKINFTDSPDEEEIQNRKERIKDLYDNDSVMDAREYCIDSMNALDMMQAVQYLLLVITLVVVLLVTILMERSFIADERSQIAILKAIGFSNGNIIGWHVGRFGLVSLVSVLLAAGVSIPMTNLCIGPVFGMMGAQTVDYRIEPLQVFLLYPGIIFAMTLLAAWVNALHTRKITSRDTANIE